MRDICKFFPGVRALDHVDFRLRRGSVHALMGENGAGKSTLMKCLFGMYGRDSGEVLLEGEPVHFKNPVDALHHGVAMVHQELNQALSRTVMDNIWLGRYPTVGGILVSERKMIRDTEKIFESLGIRVDPKRRMGSMSVSDRQMVEIAKAVSYGARVIVFDEPTSSLNDREVEHLFRIIRMLRSRGCGIVYISHKMEEILAISDEVTVMRDGKWIATEPAASLTVDRIISLMVGRSLESRFPEKTNRPAEPILEVKSLSGRYNPLREVSFTLRRGEILGVAGLAGAGRSELLETVYGLATRDGGVLIKEGREIFNRNPREAIRNGFALLTEERRATGIFGVLSIRENATVSNLSRSRVGGLFLNDRKLRRDTDWAIRAMRIKTPGQRTQIRTLSGGNQQKVILGRWLLTEPDILLLDEPTRGIDIGAKYEIYRLMIDLATQGKGVIMVSSEMPELLGVCDRILVLSGGRLAGEVSASDTSQEEIMALAAKYV
ncbi:MAG: ATP-binding cassette domain-containing protein [Clostridia bacterium]|nr:ATP-binding cassette domain-containing protein [Clostridia bacterium]